VNDAGDMTGAAAAQIGDEIEARLIWPLESLLGPDELFTALRKRAAGRARMLAAQLAGRDDRLAAQTAIDLANAVLPDAIPDDWWATPLGRLTAEAGKLERHPDGGITAAAVRMRAEGTR